ncbi:MAG: sorbosone dehydrogenase family protein [Acidimicrobiales bacterium]
MKLLVVLLLIVAAGCTNTSDSPSTTRAGQPPITTTSTSQGTTSSSATSNATDSVVTTTTQVRKAELALSTVGEGSSPLALAWRTGDDNVYVADKEGLLFTLFPDGQVGLLKDFSDNVSSEGEQGFLGLVFSPDGEWLYLSYTNPAGDSHLSVVPFDDFGPDFSAEQVLLIVEQPFDNHNGGDIHFGPDGYLYWGLGDGGSGGDPQGNGQNPDSLLGSMLRIDPRPGTGSYEIPADNPFVNGGGAPEIWLTGLRNPWRFSFDSETGDLWIGDVGQDKVEEIDLVTPSQGGANLGWNACEGDQDYDGSCDGFHAPIYTYGRADGISVTGGYIYRGKAIPQLTGQYIFADFFTASIWALDPESGERVELGLQSETVAGFAQDPFGEIWVLSLDGAIQQIVDISS